MLSRPQPLQQPRTAPSLLHQDIHPSAPQRRRPIFADRDVKGYTGLRRWCEQFYEAKDAAPGPLKISDEEIA